MTSDNCKTAGEVLSGGDWERMLAGFEAIGADDDSPEAVGAAPVARHIDRVPPFQVDGVHPQVLEAREQVRRFTRAVLRKSCAPYSLALLGGSGCGKTHLARLARAALLDAGVDCQLWAWAAVLDAYREDKGDLLRQLDETRVLVLDDIGAEFLGTEKATEFSLAKLCCMLDTRAGRWTMLTSNMLLHQVAKLDERCASRLLRNGGRLVTLDEAKDWALEHYMKNKTH